MRAKGKQLDNNMDAVRVLAVNESGWKENVNALCVFWYDEIHINPLLLNQLVVSTLTIGSTAE